MEIKLCLVGNSGVGKSAIVQRCIHNTYNPNYENTVGVLFHTWHIQVNEQRYNLKIWDTAGQERFRVISRLYYRNAKAIIIVYDITTKYTFDSLRSWLNEVKDLAPPDIVIAVIGNKSDMEKDRSVSYSDGKMYAERIGALFMETSALTSENIHELFKSIVCLVKINLPQTEDTETTPLIHHGRRGKLYRCC